MPSDVTADEPKPPPPDRPLPDLEGSARGSGCRLLVFAGAGAASGFALAVFLEVGCHTAVAVGIYTPGIYDFAFDYCFPVGALAAGGFLGLLLALIRQWWPPKRTWID
jgi:hypothetical protein